MPGVAGMNTGAQETMNNFNVSGAGVKVGIIDTGASIGINARNSGPAKCLMRLGSRGGDAG